MNPAGYFLRGFGWVGLLAVGCSPPTHSQIPNVPGTGKILLSDGQPAAHCCLLLTPMGPKMGAVCRANTRPDGSFVLKTFDKEGVVAGKYRLAIRPLITESTPGEIAEQIEEAIPEAYRDDESSPFILEVKKTEDLVIRLK